MTATTTRRRPAASFTSSARASTSTPDAGNPPAATSTTTAAAAGSAATTAAAEAIAALVGHCARGESYLPESVMTALSLLAVPRSRPRTTGNDTSTSSTSSSDAGSTDAGSTDAGSSDAGSTDAGSRADPADPADLHAAAILIPREVSDARWQVVTTHLRGYTNLETPELPTIWAAEETDLIEAADRVTAWAHHLQLGAIARLREAIGAHCEMELTPTAFLNGCSPYDVESEADTATADEVALVTGLPLHHATTRMRLAVDPYGRARVLLTRLHAGTTTLDRCLRVLEATTDCHPDDVNTIADRVLAELPDGSKPSHQLFQRRLRRQVVLHQPDPTQRHADAVSRRTAFGELLDDGTGILTVTGDGERIVAALDRIDTIARILRTGGDARTLTNLRSDITLDLLLVGWPSPPTTTSSNIGAPSSTASNCNSGTTDATESPGTPAQPRDRNENDDDHDRDRAERDHEERDHQERNSDEWADWAENTDHDTGTGSDHDSDHDGNDRSDHDSEPRDPAGLVDFTPWLTLKQAPPAHVNVIVSLTTLLGEDHATAEIPGHGFITAVHARQLAMATGSVWRRLVTDPLTGTALDLSTHRYRPTRKMADTIAALDGTCRAPGCTIPAPQCDIDHHTPWPYGPTAISNLSSKHRRHHNHKTRRTWTTTQDHDGTITWHTIGQRDYVTTRYRYTDPSHQPATDSEYTRTSNTDPPPF